MAKVIEFYIPKSFKKAERPGEKRGQLIEFSPAPKKSA
jgi:hypothetical protein